MYTEKPIIVLKLYYVKYYKFKRKTYIRIKKKIQTNPQGPTEI